MSSGYINSTEELHAAIDIVTESVYGLARKRKGYDEDYLLLETADGRRMVCELSGDKPRGHGIIKSVLMQEHSGSPCARVVYDNGLHDHYIFKMVEGISPASNIDFPIDDIKSWPELENAGYQDPL